MASEPTYLLDEAAEELARRECRAQGHTFDFVPLRLMDEAPAGVFCSRCGWSGKIAMGEKP